MWRRAARRSRSCSRDQAVPTETCTERARPASGFPPLTESKWVLGNEDRLIKIVLKGIYGPIVVNGKKYPGQVPMTPYGGLLNDKEVAAVLTYIRNSFGNKASAVDEKTVKRVREEIKNKVGFYSPDELLLLHPMEQ